MRTVALLAFALLLAPFVAEAQQVVIVPPPLSVGPTEVTVGDAVVALTTVDGVTEVLIKNRSDKILCIAFVAQADCTTPPVTMVCSDDTAATIDDDLWVIDPGATDTLPKPKGTVLCGKQPAASGNSKVIRVLEVKRR